MLDTYPFSTRLSGGELLWDPSDLPHHTGRMCIISVAAKRRKSSIYISRHNKNVCLLKRGLNYTWGIYPVASGYWWTLSPFFNGMASEITQRPPQWGPKISYSNLPEPLGNIAYRVVRSTTESLAGRRDSGWVSPASLKFTRIGNSILSRWMTSGYLASTISRFLARRDLEET